MVVDTIPYTMRVTRTLGALARRGERRLPLGRAQIGHVTLGLVALFVASGTVAAEFERLVNLLRDVYLLSGTAVVFGWILAWLAVWLVLEVAVAAALADRKGH